MQQHEHQTHESITDTALNRATVESATPPVNEVREPGGIVDTSATTGSCPVSSYNEWDPLEEVIVGHIDGAVIPAYHISSSYNLSPGMRKLYRLFGGRRYPGFLTRRAQKQLDEFVHILEAEGVRVRRPWVWQSH